MGSISDLPINILFNTGTFCSFISQPCVENLELELIDILGGLSLAMPSGKSLSISRACKERRVVFHCTTEEIVSFNGIFHEWRLPIITSLQVKRLISSEKSQAFIVCLNGPERKGTQVSMGK